MNVATLDLDKQNGRLMCQGSWSLDGVQSLMSKGNTIDWPQAETITIDGSQITHFDSAGALYIRDLKRQLEKSGQTIELSGFNKQYSELLQLIDKHQDDLDYTPSAPKKQSLVESIGQETIAKINQLDGLLVLIGDLTLRLMAALGHWKRFQLPSIISIIESAGINALPIVGLLSFLIGIVLAYQMGLQLQTYGANMFIAMLTGLAVFREFGPLITAIIVAGRTSSAFTAQIGSMKVNEEVDALQTMGLSPTEMLVMPRVIAMFLVFPLLIFWADLFGILGAMFMSKHMLDVSYVDFLTRIKNSVGLDQLLLGLYKAPIFAVIIALVGCYQGFNVGSSANSIGEKTTKSVVQALFLIIIADALYSIIYSWLDL